MKKVVNKQKRLVIIFAVFVCLLMVISILAILVNNDNSTTLKYGKQSFTTTNTGYKTKINGKNFDFTYYPTELERINISQNIYDILNNAQGMVIIFNPNEDPNNLAYMDSARFEMQTQYPKALGFGMTEESSNYNLPILTCDNATASVPFIYMNLSIDTEFTLDGNNPYCIIMNAKLKETIAAKDRLIYRMYGIMS